MTTPCEDLEAAAIQAAQEEGIRRANALAEERTQRAEAAYTDLKKRFPLLEKGPGSKVTLCGRTWDVTQTSMSIVDGSLHYSLQGPRGYGDWVYDMVSLGRWLLREREEASRKKQPGWLGRLLGL